jgi:tRNA A37 threonylcarbamoyladenosine dehydratase
MQALTLQKQFRFAGIERLYGRGSVERLRAAHILVVGIGGVGSWVAESLARSGVGQLTLVDLDDICESNINRQVHALDGVIGKPKVEAMAERCRLINPEIQVRPIAKFFTKSNASTLLDEPYDYAMDAIDSLVHKCALIDCSRKAAIPIIISGSAGGRIDPTQIRIADLTLSYNDKLLQRVRKKLRQDYGYPRERRRRFKIECVFSPETARYSEPDTCESDPPSSRRLDCASGYGAAAHVTGTFGMIAAARIVERICSTQT